MQDLHSDGPAPTPSASTFVHTHDLPVVIAAAIIEVTKKSPTLGKTERNAFAKYNYVSIDKYYEFIPPIANEQGLSWSMTQTSVEKLGDALMFTFSFHLFHTSGATVWDFMSISVPHALQGAQTSGSASSYAEKIFMRTLFKVQTGEQDADATDPASTDPKPRSAATGTGASGAKAPGRDAPDRPKVAKPSVGSNEPVGGSDDTVASFERLPGQVDMSGGPLAVKDYMAGLDQNSKPIFKKPTDESGCGLVYEAFKQFIGLCTDLEVLRLFYENNLGPIEEMKKLHPPTHKALLSMFNKAKKDLK